MIDMKKFVVFTILFVLCASLHAQNSPCPGLKNPASFTSGSTSGAFVGFYSGQTGTKSNSDPNAMTGVTGLNLTPGVIPANQLATTTDNGSNSYCGSNLSPSNQFRIMSNTDGPGTGSQMGKDPSVNYAVTYCPTTFDPSINKSIRLGNCQVSNHSEALYYTMDVRVQNALLFIYYAIIVQNPNHTSGNPSFFIRVTRRNSSNEWVQITDTLCYAIVSNGLSNGVNGWTSFSGGFYRDWNKVAINLMDFLYDRVRIEIYSGDCSGGAHYAYCYIAGDCQPMDIQTSGCPAGATPTVDTLKAPTGLNNYVWYKSNVDGQYISNTANVPDTVTWTQLTPSSGPNNNVYPCRINDFLVTQGTTTEYLTNNMVFRCDMTSAMDPAKPFISNVYVRVNNTKPIVTIDSLKTCDSELKLTNKSYVPNDFYGCDTSITKWYFYRGSDTTTGIVDSAIGGKAYHQYDSSAHYAVKLRSYNRTDHTCYSDSTYTIFALGRPKPVLEPSAREVCVSETVNLVDNTYNSRRRDWIFDSDGDGDLDIIENGPQQIRHIFTDYKNPVEMVAYNGLFTRDSIFFYDTIWCTQSAYDTIEVFQHPELLVSGDTVVCNGQQTDITVSTETEGCTYRWYRDTIPGSTQIAEGQTLRVLPYDDTCKYYVKVVSRKQCIAWDSVNAYRVNPRLSISRHDMCDGDAVSLTAEAAYSYSWTASPADSSLDVLLDENGHGPAFITVTPHQTTTYTLIGHGTNECDASPLTETITVHPLPVATVDYYPSFVDSDNPVVTLTDASPYSVRRVWHFNEGTAMETTSPCSHNFGEVSSDSVDVTLVAYNDLECSDTLEFRLPVTQFTFFAPNVFTPERPDNNTFQIYTANEQENFSVFIYDRMGRQVYTSNDLHFKWDGTSDEGIKCPQGTYVYVITYRRPGTEDIVTQKGNITLLR